MTLVTAGAGQPSRSLPSPSLQLRGEYGLIAVAQSRFAPDADPDLPRAVTLSRLQERLRAELLKQVSALRGYRFAGPQEETAPTMLEVRVERVTLAKDSLIDDAPALVLRARARLIQPSYGRSLYDQKLEYRSPKRPMSDWNRYDGALVQKDLDEGLRALAQKAADDIFLVYDPGRP